MQPFPDVYVITTHERKEPVADPLIHFLSAYKPTVIWGYEDDGTQAYSGIRIKTKKIELLSAWRRLISTAKQKAQNGILVFEDDANVISTFGDLPELIHEIRARTKPKVNAVSLCGKDVYLTEQRPEEYQLDRHTLIRSIWTGNFGIYVPPEGVIFLDRMLPSTRGKMVKMIQKRRAIDLTWSQWPGFFRSKQPMVEHSERGKKYELSKLRV